jgi:hypothetical protein
VESRATVIIPFDDRVIFVSSLNCAQFSGRLSEVAQTLDAISGESVPGQWQRARRAVASWHGPSQGLPQRVTGVVGELYAVWLSAYWHYGSCCFLFHKAKRIALRHDCSSAR